MRILVVEDTPALQRAMTELLATAGHSADAVARLDDAVSLLSRELYDLIVLDLSLPDGSGTDLLNRLPERNAGTPVFVVSARADLEDRVALLNSGADDYLVKPFDPKEFLARVGAILRRPKVRSEEVIQLANLQLNTATRQVFETGSGKELQFTPRERSVLITLLQRPSVPVSREHLTNQLFSLESAVQPGAVEVYVSRVRSKLKAAGITVAIRAVRGLGYVIGGDE